MPETAHTAGELLSGIKNISELGEYLAENLRDDLAKSWANGEHNVVKWRLAPGESYTAAENVHYDLESRGATVGKCITISRISW